jgi:hypothetical protein
MFHSSKVFHKTIMPGAAMLEMAFAAASSMISESDGKKAGKGMLSDVSIPMAMDLASSKTLRCNVVFEGGDSSLIIDSFTSSSLAVKHLKASVRTMLGTTILLLSRYIQMPIIILVGHLSTSKVC